MRGSHPALALATEARDRGDAAAARKILEGALATASGASVAEVHAELALVLVGLRELGAARACLAACPPEVMDAHPAARFARATLMWSEVGRTAESRAAFDAALSSARAAGDPELAIGASLFIAEDELAQGDGAAALHRLRAALGEAGTRELRRLRVRVLLALARALLRHDAPSQALEHAQQGLHVAIELGNPALEASALGLITAVLSRSGTKDEALESAQRGWKAAETSGDPGVLAQAAHSLAMALLAAGDPSRAAVEFGRCVSIARERRDLSALCISLGGLGEALLACGDVTGAERNVAEALAAARQVGDRGSEALAQQLIARVAEAKGDFPGALAAERERSRIDGELRFKQTAQSMDRIRAELQAERQQSEEARAAEHALRTALAEVKRLEERLALENQYLREEIVASGGFENIVGRAEPLQRVLRRIEQVAPTEASVLINGETGVGKELVARAIHARSLRRDRTLVTVNCAALPAALIESELFGHERGAFTGALQRKIGRFELADGGTIFLDEIGELPLELQAKLLRVLQEGEFERLGESVTRRTDVRVIAASNRDLAAESRAGRFRSDLYYRLAVFTIDVPPLRERRDDIPLLVAHFASRYQGRLGKRIERIPEETLRRFVAHDWPGNVRELANVVHRAVILCTGDALVLDAATDMLPRAVHARTDAPDEAAPPAPPMARVEPSDDSLEAVERAHVRRVLESCDWQIKGKGNAADRLGVPPSTLRSRMQRLGISREARSRA